MAIIKCPECGQNISDKSNVCIHCGYPITDFSKKIKVHVHRKKEFLGCSLTNVIIIDDVQMGSVNSGESCEFYIEPGLHNITIAESKNSSMLNNGSEFTRQVILIDYADLFMEIEYQTKFMGVYVVISSLEQKKIFI